MNEVYTGLSASFLHLIVDVPLDRDHAERYRLVLTRLLLAIKLANSNANIMEHKAEVERSNNEKHCFSKICIDQLEDIPRSIT